MQRSLIFSERCNWNRMTFVALKNLGRLFKKRSRPDLARKYLNRALLLTPKDNGVCALLEDIDCDAPE